MGVPFRTSEIALAADRDALAARRKSRDLFVKASEAARRHECLNGALEYEKYALWLELTDSDLHQEGLDHLNGRISDSAHGLAFVSYGLEFDVGISK